MTIFIQNPLVVYKLSLFSGMLNDALMHREGLKGFTMEYVQLTISSEKVNSNLLLFNKNNYYSFALHDSVLLLTVYLSHSAT